MIRGGPGTYRPQSMQSGFPLLNLMWCSLSSDVSHSLSMMYLAVLSLMA